MQAINENFWVSAQITEEHFKNAKNQGITLIINNRPDHEEPGIISVENAAKLADKYDVNYLHLPMANGQPLPEDLIPKMQEALKKQDASGEKTLAHCRSGTRSSFLWGCIQIIEKKLTADEVVSAASSAGINLVGFMPFLQHLEA